MKQGLKDTAVQYCHRVIDQCERSTYVGWDLIIIITCICNYVFWIS